ncbi:phosphomannomutase/phosphoglucomutase [Brachybacterium sp. UMB0905]|uniref:phosphomannomutase/phosphoglucomutase n=1 Tax=Brachybacterium sp. UMB0905 TaxID=2069310 RepID=UPI000C7FEDCA|nr:phosphomannomutase/phosphoglucomutase [Brachybacterium sp. UMB0905]PMC76532.1 phosphomannomutase/phosphoglucomutase [Brachybacterium sp. UMB0905]
MSERTSADLSAIVKTSDIRGEAGVTLTVEVARALGAAFADLLDAPEIVVAHDMRVSSPQLADAVIDGAVRRGAVVADAGLASTDQLYCASGLHQAAGVMITASHNPAADNGMKFCRAGARPIGRDDGLAEIRRRAEEHLAAGEIPARGQGRAEQIETLADYTAMLHRLAPLPPGRDLHVIVDAGNAMAGLTAPAVLGDLLGITLEILHGELDGSFPHHAPDPMRPENLADLQQAVTARQADLGLAFDGDADRCVVLDETGAAVPPSAVTALIAQREIARARAAGEEQPTVLANLVSSRHVAEAITAAGGRHVSTPVGHSLIKALMAQHDAVFGGEHSAHYYFRDFFRADSGMLAALHVIAALRESDGPASQLVARHSPYAISGEINSRHPAPAAARARVRAWAEGLPGAAVQERDGLIITHWDEAAPPAEQWWLTLRSSTTEPLLRLNVEAREAATMEQIRDTVQSLIAQPGSEGDTEPEPRGEREQATEHEQPVGVLSQTAEAATDVELPAGASGADVPRWVRTALRCPDCGGHLRDVPAALQCAHCRRVHPVEDGIPVLIAGRTSAPGQ